MSRHNHQFKSVDINIASSKVLFTRVFFRMPTGLKEDIKRAQ